MLKRTKYPELPEESCLGVVYDHRDEPIITSLHLVRRLLQEENGTDLVSLYQFYCYTAKWQHTDKPKATTQFCMKGLHWGEARVNAAKVTLIRLGLVENAPQRDENGRVVGWYIKVNWAWKIDEQPKEITRYTENKILSQQDLVPEGTNAFTTFSKRKNIISITPSLFEQFWQCYPRKVDKGKALKAWEKLCRRPTSKRPTWKEIRLALHKQKQSERWQTREFIPHPTTWLNNNRWLDDPAEMKSSYIKPTETPATVEEVVTRHFNGDAEKWMKECIGPAIQASDGADTKIAEAVCDLYQDVKNRQKRPDYATVPKPGDAGRGMYCNWRDLVPTPFNMVRKYVVWLLRERHMKRISHHIFNPNGTYFKWFLDELRGQIACDPFTGVPA